jgi:hypothetical protein
MDTRIRRVSSRAACQIRARRIPKQLVDVVGHGVVDDRKDNEELAIAESS